MKEEQFLDKKELRGLNQELVSKIITKVKEENKELVKKLEAKEGNVKSKEFKELKKIIRKKLRVIHGSFAVKKISDYKKKKILDLIKKDPSNADLALDIHRSCRERLPYYQELYDFIKIKDSVLDIGCGLNGFSYPYFKKNIFYKGIDVNEEELSFVKQYFEQEKINGVLENLDLTNKDNIEKIGLESEKFECVFLLKTLDTLESIERNISEKIMKIIKSKKIVVSFPTRTLGGKKLISSERTWFKKIKKENYNTSTYEIDNEIFYIFNKK